MNRTCPVPLLAALLTTGLSAGCLPAAADVPPPEGPLVHLDNAVASVERAASAVVAGVASGTIDLSTRGPDLVAAFTRLNLASSRADRVVERAPVAELVPADAALADAPPGEEPPGVHNDGGPPTQAVASGTARARPAPGTAPTTTTTAATAPAQKEEVTSGASSSKTAVVAEKTGVPSIDAFLQSTASLSNQMMDCQTRLESARGKLTSSLGLAKKFKPEDAQKALKEKLGTGYKITLGPPPNIVPGPDAKDPGIVNNLKSAITDLMTVQKAVPGLIQTATKAGQEGAQIPTKAKTEIMALGPMKSVEAVGKVTKGVKAVTKIPKEAKDLGDEVASWTKVLGG